MVMDLRIGENTIRPDVDEVEEVPSKHSGRVLKIVTVSFSVHQRRSQLVEELLAEAKEHGATSTNDEGDTITWSVEQKQYSYSSDSDYRYYRWKLAEREELNVESLLIGDVEIVPYAYREFEQGGRIEIVARFVSDPDRLEQLYALARSHEPVDVVRVGIQDTPRPMQLAMRIWSESEGERKQEVHLADPEETELIPALSQTFGPLWGSHDTVIRQQATLEGLMEVLRSKGLIDESDLQKIEEDRAQREHTTARSFKRVRDLDEWELG
jgi:hypothetical protein